MQSRRANTAFKGKCMALHLFEDNYCVLFCSQVSQIQEKSSELEVKNKHLISDFEECQRNHSEFVEKTSKQSQIAQKAHDDKVNQIWMDGKWEPTVSLRRRCVHHSCFHLLL